MTIEVTQSLADALPSEIKRCQELVIQYKEVGQAGAFGALMIQRDIDRAVKALASGDVLGMLAAYAALKESE